MTISKKFLNIVLVLLLLSGVGSAVYFALGNNQRASALEESTEYQVLTVIETQYPEVYVVAVKEMDGHALLYYTLPDTDQDETYFKQLAADLVATLYNGYPNAAYYHLLMTRIVDLETFEGSTHVGIADRGILFTNRAAGILASSDSPADELDPLFEQGQIEFYPAQTHGLHIVAKPTLRERGHIPPWVEVED